MLFEEFVKRVFTLTFRLSAQTTEYSFNFNARLRTELFDFRPVFHKCVPNMPGSRNEIPAVVVLKNRDDLYVPKRVIVESNTPQRPVTDDLDSQAGKPQAWDRLADYDSGQLLHEAANPVVFEADVLQPLVPGIPALE